MDQPKYECPWHGAMPRPTCAGCEAEAPEPAPEPVQFRRVTGRCYLCGVLVMDTPMREHIQTCDGPGEVSALDPFDNSTAALMEPPASRLWLDGGWRE